MPAGGRERCADRLRFHGPRRELIPRAVVQGRFGRDVQVGNQRGVRLVDGDEDHAVGIGAVYTGIDGTLLSVTGLRGDGGIAEVAALAVEVAVHGEPAVDKALIAGEVPERGGEDALP